jgi:hypothetical protein
VFVFLSVTGQAQDILDFKYTLVGENIEISYTLSGKSTDRYEVNLYRSTDGFTQPLLMVEGDIGPDQLPGKGKKIVWKAKEELGEFKGNLSLKLKAVFIPFVEFQISKGDKFKRGKAYDLSWQFGDILSEIKLELYKGSRKVADLAPELEDTSFNWQIPKKFALGDGYYLRATGDGREARSAQFSVKRKVPMAVFIIPGALIVGGVTYLILNAGSGTGSEIPDPILPN